MDPFYRELVNQFPFVKQYVGDHAEDVNYAQVFMVCEHTLNFCPLSADVWSRDTQTNVYFFGVGGELLHKMVPSGDKDKGKRNSPLELSIGRTFYTLADELKKKVVYILVGEWETKSLLDGEKYDISLTLYYPPRRYHMYEFIDELKGEIRWLQVT